MSPPASASYVGRNMDQWQQEAIDDLFLVLTGLPHLPRKENNNHGTLPMEAIFQDGYILLPVGDEDLLQET